MTYFERVVDRQVAGRILASAWVPLALLAVLMALVLLGAGCASIPGWVDTVVTNTVQGATCVAVQQEPQCVPYLSAVADVFGDYAKGALPTPAELQASLAGVPGAGFDTTAGQAVWASVVVAYGVLYSPALTQPERVRIQALLAAVALEIDQGIEQCQTDAKFRASDKATMGTALSVAEAIKRKLK